jgi:hypothetical protein
VQVLSNEFEDFLDIHAVEHIAVFAYFDETGTHAKAPNVVVAGYLFTRDGAKDFRKEFVEKIAPLLPADKRGRLIYRSTKCMGGYDQFAVLSDLQRKEIVNCLTDAIISSATFGIVEAMPKDAYDEAIKAAPSMRKLAGDPYSIALVRCIENLAGWLDKKKISGRVQYIFEAGCNHQREANVILDGISASDTLKNRYRWRGYSFIEKDEDVPQLYAPDLLAWEWQRMYLNREHPERGELRTTLGKLARAKPHVAEYLTSTSVGLRGIVNMFYGVTDSESSADETKPRILGV